MNFSFSYHKKKVIQAIRLHFIARPEIKILMIVVNVFAVASALLFYAKKIQPQAFLIGSLVWLLLLVAVWYILPYSIYKKSSTFKDAFIIYINSNSIRLESEKGSVVWQWNLFIKYFESPHFVHLYFNERSFFLVPTTNLNEADKHDLRALLQQNIPLNNK